MLSFLSHDRDDDDDDDDESLIMRIMRLMMVCASKTVRNAFSLMEMLKIFFNLRICNQYVHVILYECLKRKSIFIAMEVHFVNGETK